MSTFVSNRLPSTRLKIFIGRLLYGFIRLFGRKRTQIVTRKGVRYELDLSDGIELSVYLFGGFQGYIARSVSLPRGGIVMDVGANIGTVTLWAAKNLGVRQVHSFEPADALFRKLERNVELNPELRDKVILNKAFLSDRSEPARDQEVYARWPLKSTPGAHPIHGGSRETASRTPTLTLDEYVRQHMVDRIDFIKIDTDGSELNVLRGARRVLSEFRPIVVFEVGGYLLEERRESFVSIIDIFESLGYRLIDLKKRKETTRQNFHRMLPKLSTTDILAVRGNRG